MIFQPLGQQFLLVTAGQRLRTKLLLQLLHFMGFFESEISYAWFHSSVFLELNLSWFLLPVRGNTPKRSPPNTVTGALDSISIPTTRSFKSGRWKGLPTVKITLGTGKVDKCLIWDSGKNSWHTGLAKDSITFYVFQLKFIVLKPVSCRALKDACRDSCTRPFIQAARGSLHCLGAHKPIGYLFLSLLEKKFNQLYYFLIREDIEIIILLIFYFLEQMQITFSNTRK